MGVSLIIPVIVMVMWCACVLQGRTNKLVDGCYSFWQGGVFPLLYMALKETGKLGHPGMFVSRVVA